MELTTEQPTLEVILMRLGEPDEDEDKLSDYGIGQVQSVIEKIITDDFFANIVLCSPIGRAQHTARLVVEAYQAAGHQVAMRVDERLDNGNSLIHTVLSELKEEKKVLLVGHRPDIGDARYNLIKDDAKSIRLCTSSKDGMLNDQALRERLTWMKKDCESLTHAKAARITIQTPDWGSITSIDSHVRGTIYLPSESFKSRELSPY